MAASLKSDFEDFTNEVLSSIKSINASKMPDDDLPVGERNELKVKPF